MAAALGLQPGWNQRPGGAELAFEQPAITRDMVVVIGGIIILFAGALDGLFRRLVARFFVRSPRYAEA